MDDQEHANSHQSMSIRLEILPEDTQQIDIAEIDEIGRNIVDQLKQDGCNVEPFYAGSKGGGPIFDIVVHIYRVIHGNEELLAAIFASISLALQGIIKERERRTAREKAQRDPFEITLYVDNKPLKIQTPDTQSAVKLVEQFQNSYPNEAKKVTVKSSVSIQVQVPKKKDVINVDPPLPQDWHDPGQDILPG